MHELISLVALRKLSTPQLSAGPLGDRLKGISMMHKLSLILLLLFSTVIARGFQTNIYKTIMSANDSLIDVFPLAVGNQLMYNYQWLYFNDYPRPSTDTGTVTLQVISKNIKTDTIIWSLQEYYSLYHEEDTSTKFVGPIQSIDTIYVIELIQGHHQLITLGTTYKSVFTFYEHADTLVYRYAVTDSSGMRTYRSDYDGAGFIFSFKQGVGPTSVEALDLCTCSTTFHGHYSLRSQILNNVLSPREELLTDNYLLLQNYPNPFNPTTTITFYVPHKSFLLVEIFDCLGRKVATPVSGEFSSGTFSRIWNATNLPSGVYYYRLQAGSFTQTKKIILLR